MDSRFQGRIPGRVEPKMIMALTKCPECDHDVSTRATACPRCGFPLVGCPTATQQSTTNSATETSAGPAAPLKAKSSGVETLTGTVLILGLAAAVCFGVYRYSTTQSNTSNQSESSRDPRYRYVGPSGAVVGTDSLGRATRLAPGTPVKPTGSRYIDPMNGPTTIYLVVDGELKGTTVPVRDRDLEAK